MKNKAELKAAMESLQVKKPLKLQDGRPQFKTPPSIQYTPPVPVETKVVPETQTTGAAEVSLQTTVPEITSVRLPTHGEVAATTQVPVKPQVVSETPVTPSIQVLAETKVRGRTSVDSDSEVPKQTLVAAATPVPVQTQVVAQTKVTDSAHGIFEEGIKRSASDQDSSVTLEAQAAPKLHQGYTRLPNSILMRMASGDLIRSEMQVLLLVARFTISFQRRHAPLSKTVLERQSGMRGPAVLHAISALQAKGLIQKIPGDQHRPNQLGLVFGDEWDFFTKSGAQVPATPLVPTQAPVATPTMVSASSSVVRETPVAGGATAQVHVPTPAGVSGATSFKDIKTIKNKNSLSELPEALQKYFDELKPAKKRESERKAFQELQADYAIHDIGDCLTLLQERGVGPGNEAQVCHSPMAFLSRAMTEILIEVESRRKKAYARSEHERLENKTARERHEFEAREAAKWAKKERAFNKAFPGEDHQHETLAELLRGLPFSTKSQPGRILGIGKWWDQLTQYERQELTNG